MRRCLLRKLERLVWRGGCYHDVSAGDFKFNVILQWPDDDKAEKDYTVDVTMEFKTDKKIVQREEDGPYTYHVEGSNTNLYIPNQYYGHFRHGDSEMMRLEVMEGGFPRRIDTTTEGSSLFAFRFRKSSMIFYDPDITCLVQTEPMPIIKTDFARQIQVSDQNSFGGAVSISAADLVKAFQVFSSYSVGGLDAEVMFNSVKEGTIGEAVQWPDGDLFFYHIHFKKKFLGFTFPGFKAKSSMKDLWYEIYEIKASDAAVDKTAARKMLKDELQAKIDANGSAAGFDTFVKYYNEKFRKSTGRGTTRREKRAIKKGQKLDADLRALETEKDNKKKKQELSRSDSLVSNSTSPGAGAAVDHDAETNGGADSTDDAVADDTNGGTGSTDGAGTDANTDDAGSADAISSDDDDDADAIAAGSGNNIIACSWWNNCSNTHIVLFIIVMIMLLLVAILYINRWTE